MPPPGLVRLTGQGHEGVDLRLVRDPVGLQQLLDVQDLQADLGLLHAADGGVSDVECPARLFVRQTAVLPQVLQAPAEHHSQNGGSSTTRTRVHHYRSPPTAVMDKQFGMDAVYGDSLARTIL